MSVATRLKNWRRPSAGELWGPLLFLAMGVVIIVWRVIPTWEEKRDPVPVSGWGVDVVGWALVALGVWALVPVFRHSHQDEDAPAIGRQRRQRRR